MKKFILLINIIFWFLCTNMQAKVVVWHHEGKNPIIEITNSSRLRNKTELPESLQSDCGKTFIGWTQSPTIDPDSKPVDLIPTSTTVIQNLPNLDTIHFYTVFAYVDADGTYDYATSCYGVQYIHLNDTILIDRQYGETILVGNFPMMTSDNSNEGWELVNWSTSDMGEKNGQSYNTGDTIVIKNDIDLYAQWRWDLTNQDGFMPIISKDKEVMLPIDITISGGSTLSLVSSCNEIFIKSLTLKGGLKNATSYAMPGLLIPESINLWTLKDLVYNFDLSVNNNCYYPFAVPFPVYVGDVDYADSYLASKSTYGKHFVIKRYDQNKRALNGENKDENWVIVEDTEFLYPGEGYIITAIPVNGEAIIRFPLYNESEVDVDIPVSYTNSPVSPLHSGWNFVANPYLAKYNGQDIANAPLYACIPTYNFSKYEQIPLFQTTLNPEYPFFVQVESDATLNFASASRRQAPAAVRSANENNQTQFATFNILQNDNQKMDHTGIVLNNDYTTAYEINADLEKMFGSAYTTSLYSVNQNLKLAYNAMSHKDAQSSLISMGYRAEEAGQYTIALENPEDLLEYENVLLHDNLTDITTNLLYTDYTFDTERTQDDGRFTIQFIGRNNTATDIANIYSTNTSTTKIIKDNQLYIIRDGQTYNAAGILVE